MDLHALQGTPEGIGGLKELTRNMRRKVVWHAWQVLTVERFVDPGNTLQPGLS